MPHLSASYVMIPGIRFSNPFYPALDGEDTKAIRLTSLAPISTLVTTPVARMAAVSVSLQA